mgnify:CR=1 FL=1
MEISEKVAYLKGLAEGLALDSDTKEGKLIAAIIDVLDDMAEKFVDLEDELCDVEDGLDAVSDDLSDVEQALYELDDDVDEDEDEDYDDDDESYFARRRSSSTRIPWRAARSAAPTAARSWSSISATWPTPRTTRTRSKPKQFKKACCLWAARFFSGIGAVVTPGTGGR